MMIRLDSASAPKAITHALLVSTQCHENYAWREDGTLDADNPYWKAKGGSDFLVLSNRLDADSTDLEQNIVLDMVRYEIEHDNFAFREYIIGYRLVPANYDPAEGIEADPSNPHCYAKYLRESLTRIMA